ncbi:MerR-family transcriptional regulator [[Actinomadura] parvosata subsp. kistnae]|uniref:MerR family transcriptional regulator n=1 Tax=[Actinomadura] parvosata subsp. kistnae TaxID=1909395 RepID=A0A1U9ZUE8_9ACTN|nr:MerR family transcriptional regulator [Nonomuraea sp. ATCC 55076]AQZ61539.1 MerR family transcriptional regulator [Nonomuraea sp. ATCC 55076]SPL98258.1 MerR-family transcriptional regulator [Actinomadura parvosata subsp. kistnae]
MSDGLYTIGELARRTGLPVRTIRFWSDSGVLPPTGRSAGGYRLYDEAAVTRLGLVRMLRELGVGLDTVQEVLARRVTVAEVARLRLRAVDAELRALRARRAVLSLISERGTTNEETLMLHRLAQLSAAERREIVTEFVSGTFDGIEPDGDAAVIAGWMRELPDSPSPAQMGAWVELAELISDEDFRRRLRRIALAGEGPLPAYELRARVLAQAGPALADGVDPASAAGRAVLDRVAGPAADRAELLEWMETVADERVERYWALLAELNGHPRAEPAVPAFAWVIAALRAHGTGR